MKSNKQKTNLKKPTIIISIASLAFIISLFFQLILGASKWKNEINSQMKIYIYLDDSLDVKGINSLIFYCYIIFIYFSFQITNIFVKR